MLFPFVMLVGVAMLYGGAHKMRAAAQYRVRRADLLANGLRTEGSVTTVTQVGTHGTYDPVVRIAVRFTTPDGRTRDAWASYELPVTILAGLTPGTRLPVIVDPEEPLSLVIDWASRRR